MLKMGTRIVPVTKQVRVQNIESATLNELIDELGEKEVVR